MHERPANACADFTAMMNAAMDGDAPTAELRSHPHPSHCESCAAMLTLVDLLLVHSTPVPALSANFTDGVLAAVNTRTSELRRRRLYATCGFAALAASVAIAFWLQGPEAPVRTNPTIVARPMPTVTASVNDAKSAVASLTANVAEETLAPARKLFAGNHERVAGASPEVVPALPVLPDVATAGLQPIASTTRRAFDALVRDVSSFSSAVK